MSAKNFRPRRFDLIAFDWDGTLFDSTAIIVRCIQAAVRDVGGTVPTDKEAAYVIGMGLMQALAHAAPDVPTEKYTELGNRYRFHYIQHQDDLSLFDGVLPLLNDLRERGHLLAVATGKSRRGLDHVLHQVQLRGMFDGSRTAAWMQRTMMAVESNRVPSQSKAMRSKRRGRKFLADMEAEVFSRRIVRRWAQNRPARGEVRRAVRCALPRRGG